MKLVRKEVGKTFSERVVELALMVPNGRVTTYGRIARAAGGGRQAARSVTAILGLAYERGEKRIPFHRIVYADGRIWLNGAHCSDRLILYKKEHIEIDKKGMIKNFPTVLYEFK
jgi:methylated-DNA-protein-cysteine methyltransferase-like protein